MARRTLTLKTGIGHSGAMTGQPLNRFKEDRPLASPEAAARKLLEIVQAEVAESGLPHGYTGTWNSSFTRSGGSIAEYAAGRDYGVAQGWFSIDDSGTRVTPKINPPTGAAAS